VCLIEGVTLAGVDEGRGRVAGLTMLQGRIFVVRSDPSRQLVTEYDHQVSLTAVRDITVTGMDDSVLSMTSCVTNQCLYVGDDNWNVFKISINTSSIKSWKVGDWPLGLSVTRDCNVLVTCYWSSVIYEYTTDGSLIRKISLDESHVSEPTHTVEWTDGQWLVCHRGPVAGVSVVDSSGRVVVSYRNNKDNKVFNAPVHLIVTNNESVVMILDCNNNRIMTLNRTLTHSSELNLPTELNGPRCMYYDELNRRLYVGELYGQQRVIVFDNVL